MISNPEAYLQQVLPLYSLFMATVVPLHAFKSQDDKM